MPISIQNRKNYFSISLINFNHTPLFSLTLEEEKAINNAHLIFQILKAFPADVSNYKTKKKTRQSKRSAVYKNGCLAATRLYSLRNDYKSVEIALSMNSYNKFEQKFHGPKIAPSDSDEVPTFLIDKLCEKKWKDIFHQVNQQFLNRPSIIF